MSRAKTILVADPDLESAKYVAIVLENEGFRVTTTRDGAEALQKLRAAPPDLVLLEIPMPDKNGYQVCREIKEDSVLRTLPVVILSAKAQPSDRFWAKRVGADGFVAKPFDPADLLREVNGLLDHGRPRGRAVAAKDAPATSAAQAGDSAPAPAPAARGRRRSGKSAGGGR